MSRFAIVLFALATGFSTPVLPAEITLDLQTASVLLDAGGRVGPIRFDDGSTWPKSGEAAFAIVTDRGGVPCSSVDRRGDRLTITFADEGSAVFRIKEGNGFAIFDLDSLRTSRTVKELHLFRIRVPEGAEIIDPLNAAAANGKQVALTALVPGVHAFQADANVTRGDRAGCTHRFEPVEDAKSGRYAAQLTATCDQAAGGWVVRGRALPCTLDLRDCYALRAWVHGDGGGQSLKIQLHGAEGGYRDDYIPITFQGWRQVTLDKPALNTLQYDRVRRINFYFNSMPASKTVSCKIDRVEALLRRDGNERVVVLEDFEDLDSPLFAGEDRAIQVKTLHSHGNTPARFALIAAPRGDFFDTSIRCDEAAGLRVPRLDGVPAKRSDRIKRSYFFLTGFRESQFDDALAIARRGGFDTILILQDSWCESTGHFEVNRKSFPDGLEGLKRTVKRFKDARFHVGFHFLAASVYPPDAYLTPVPDPRLVTKATVPLASDVDATATFIPASTAPEGFPTEDGGYVGQGTVLRIGDELVKYGGLSMKEPYGFENCRRGHLGTKPAAHAKGTAVKHLLRSYGYHLYDMDTNLLDEVTTNFARVADACDVDMVYFDGAERLQGDHWYYNGLMIQSFYEKLKRSDILLQASSSSHFSWRFLARNASADGHGDIKGYLDQRSPAFDYFAKSGMPLDIGWYYGYDTNTSLDMYEYILGTTIGYDSSMSFQVSPEAAEGHPFTGAILDRIARYERLRLSGRVGEEMKARLRVASELCGKSDEARPALVHHRREYRLVGKEGAEVFQRVRYEPWDWERVEKAAEGSQAWRFEVTENGTEVGFQIHVLDGPMRLAGRSYLASEALPLESFDDLAPYRSRATSNGVTQEFASGTCPETDGPCAVYSAKSDGHPGGWSMVGRTFDKPVDLTGYKGLSFWLRGNGAGGQFKLQLRDAAGNALDFYISNDFTGWTYRQVALADGHPTATPPAMDAIRALSLYYNGLPQGAVQCAVDDIKALRAIDEPVLANPAIRIGKRRVAYRGPLRVGQYLFAYPGEPAQVYGPKWQALVEVPIETISLDKGVYEATLESEGGIPVPVRVRVVLQPPERYEVE